jgi:hypothetical protein
MLFLAVVIYLHQGRILRGGVERCAPPLRSFCTSPENFSTYPERSCTSPWESFNDGTKWKCDDCLGSTLISYLCKIETVIAIHLCVKYPFNRQCFERNFVAIEMKGKIGVIYIHNSLIYWYICTLHAYLTSLILACSTINPNFPWELWARPLHLPKNFFPPPPLFWPKSGLALHLFA